MIKHVEAGQSITATPAHLYSAVRRNDLTRVVELLAAGANPNHLAKGCGAVVVQSCTNASPEILRALLAAGACPNSFSNKHSGRPPLHIAAGRSILHARALLEAGADVHAIITGQWGGQTALFFACGGDMVRLLVEWGADVNAADTFGMTPLYAAAQDGRYETVLALLSCGADPNIGVRPYVHDDNCMALIDRYVQADARRQSLLALVNVDPAEPVRRSM